MDWKCDGEIDCSDGSDEAEEVCGIVKTCPEGEKFKYKSGECISFTLRCSGAKDCSDGSDEDDCSKNNNYLHFDFHPHVLSCYAEM